MKMNTAPLQAPDVFEYIEWLQGKYRSHVHVFEREAGFGIRRLTEQRLGVPLEEDHAKFLRQHNGVSFFHNHLQLC